MPKATSFTIPYFQWINEKSEVVGELPKFAEDADTLTSLYRAMMLTRIFDKKAVALQRTGKLGTYPSSLGQEAISVAIGSVMQADDVLFPYYREYGAQFMRGVKMKEILLYWGGDERGMDYQGPRKDFPICVPIATHAPHAVGVAYAMKLRQQRRVAVFVCGDGATSKGDFYEAINAAGIWKLPVVFIVNNNQWAISVRRESQTGSDTIAQKAIAAGFDGEQVDGNDIVAVRQQFQQALDKARDGQGPTLIEAITYRLCDHTTADDATRYRSEEEVKQHWQREPILRLKNYLTQQNSWDNKKEKALIAECGSEVEKAVDAYLATPAQQPESMFDYMYESMPHDLKAQRRAFLITGK
ncbi:MAG: pyruvate dehydrogenase (acetyl-transferring) E1 component subunit alpha [Gammaproteobacteria bacterium]|nr:pyruvate dehydrogenase (acetyl-transferring) E1 component subunit alpha [Gammaproteobacteria bacterium]